MDEKIRLKAIFFASMLMCTNLIAVTALSPRSLSVSGLVAPGPRAALSQRGDWELQASGVSQDLHGVAFFCLNRGSIAGDQGIILRTGNGGKNWTTQDSGVQENLHDIGYGYLSTLAVGDSGTILLTNDSGQTWIVKQTGMMGSYYGAQMINETVGVAVGVNAVFQPFFTRTDDGWNTWNSVSFYIEHDSVSYEGRLSDVCFVNESYGFASAIVDVPAGGAIARTMDGGGSWETVYFSTTPVYGIDFSYSGIGFAVGEDGVILRSLDMGQTWNEVDSGVSNPLYAVNFPSDTVGYAVGSSGLILRTADGGSTWTAQSSGITTDLYGVTFLGEYFGMVVGESGVILHTDTGGLPKDTWPPETTCTLNGTMQGDVYVSNVTVTLAATDNVSGVADTVYCLDAGNWTIYVEPLLVVADGAHLLKFYSTDNAGNAEEEKTCAFTIQRPSLMVTISGGLGVHMTVKNTGLVDFTNETWNLSLADGLLLRGRHASGVVSLGAGDEVTLKSLVLGVGRTQVTFSMASSETIVAGSVFLFFVRIA